MSQLSWSVLLRIVEERGFHLQVDLNYLKVEFNSKLTDVG